MLRRDIEFAGQGGTTLRGWLYVPDGLSRTPGVVMAHGFSATKEMVLDDYAAFLCQAGLCVLIYDHRNLGASEGEPRQEINPWAQTRDYLRAIDWLGERPEVDPLRIGIWGSSFSAGEAIVVAACDRRVRAVVANVPFAALPGVDYSHTRERFEAIREALLDTSGNGLADRPEVVVGPLSVVEEPGCKLDVFLPQPEARDWFLRVGRESWTWRNRVTVCNGFGAQPDFDPGVCIEYVSPTPLLLVVAREDRVAKTQLSLEAFERAGEPKRLELIDGHHFSAYEETGFARAASVARDFYLEQL